jgi:hypothetical protein
MKRYEYVQIISANNQVIVSNGSLPDESFRPKEKTIVALLNSFGKKGYRLRHMDTSGDRIVALMEFENSATSE